MKITTKSLTISLALTGALALPLSAQGRLRAGESLPMTPAQRTFAQSYLSAITGPDIERYKRLLHPRTRACMTPANAEYFDGIFKRRVNRVARNPELSVQKLKDSQIFAAARSNGFTYPARPTHTVNIDLVSTGTRQSAVVVFAVKENGIWYEVLPCPSAKSLQLMREAKRQDAADSVIARALADSLPTPLRSELLALLTDSGSVSAAKRYS